MHLLETRDLVKSYGQRRVVDGVCINVKRGEVVGLLGPNGAGKTTTFYMVTGIIPPDDGRIIFDRRDITNISMHHRARYGIGYLSQEPSIFRRLTVAENIQVALDAQDLTAAERSERMESLLEETLEPRQNRKRSDAFLAV